MNSVAAFASLRKLGKVVITTEDASIRLGATLSAASRTLGRLASCGLVLKLRHGLWSLDPNIDPLAIPEHMTAPFPSYVSLQSALYFHGMISQIPQVIYVVSLGPPKRVRTVLATYSIHRLAPDFFGGDKMVGGQGVRLASPEKAVLDILYLSSSKTGLFSRLPEMELTRRFNVRRAREWIAKIPSAQRRAMVERRFESLLLEAQADAPRRARQVRVEQDDSSKNS